MEYTTLKNAEDKIGKDYFVRCNRCYLVQSPICLRRER